jgi:hypothetical protein
MCLFCSSNIAADHDKDTTMVEFTNGKVSPSARAWLTNKNVQPLYDAAEPLLYFLDKYATIMVGGARAMGKYYSANKSKTLLDKLTVTDIAYSIFVYESAHDVWEEEIVKTRTCDTKEEKKAFQHVAVSKYHVKRGTRIGLYRDGWTGDGQVYFRTICKEILDMMKNDKLWSTLKLHWSSYVKKYHKYSYIRDEDNAADNDDDMSTSDKENDDNDCIVSLPGEDDDASAGYMLGDGSESEQEDEDNEPGRSKRPRMYPV